MPSGCLTQSPRGPHPFLSVPLQGLSGKTGPGGKLSCHLTVPAGHLATWAEWPGSELGSLTAGVTLAVDRGYPEVRRAGVEHHGELLGRGPDGDLPKVLTLGTDGTRVRVGTGHGACSVL